MHHFNCGESEKRLTRSRSRRSRTTESSPREFLNFHLRDSRLLDRTSAETRGGAESQVGQESGKIRTRKRRGFDDFVYGREGEPRRLNRERRHATPSDGGHMRRRSPAATILVDHAAPPPIARVITGEIALTAGEGFCVAVSRYSRGFSR